MYFEWRPYVSVAERRQKAAREMERLRKKGVTITPVRTLGRAIAKTFWGSSWCTNLERYGDYANRLPRGRAYVRNGSVVDLQVAPGKVTARVSGSEIYQVEVDVAPVPAPRWKAVVKDCAGSIDSLVELLQGRFAKGVMERLCRQGEGLFPTPKEIRFSCSCPDWASMCKHVAAALYGVGVRLDERPELLFRLRKVSEEDLLARAGKDIPLARSKPARGKVLSGAEVGEVFGIEMADARAPDAGPAPQPAVGRGAAVKGAAVKGATVKGAAVKGARTRTTTAGGTEGVGKIGAGKSGGARSDGRKAGGAKAGGGKKSRPGRASGGARAEGGARVEAGAGGGAARARGGARARCSASGRGAGRRPGARDPGSLAPGP